MLLCNKPASIPVDHFQNKRSHFILSGFKYYVLTLKNKYNVLVLMLYCKTLFAAIEVWSG